MFQGLGVGIRQCSKGTARLALLWAAQLQAKGGSTRHTDLCIHNGYPLLPLRCYCLYGLQLGAAGHSVQPGLRRAASRVHQRRAVGQQLQRPEACDGRPLGGQART